MVYRRGILLYKPSGSDRNRKTLNIFRRTQYPELVRQVAKGLKAFNL
jgi:hypothetical protein